MSARTWLSTFGILFAVSTLSVNCGGGSSSPPTENDYCPQRAQKECVVAGPCSADPMACQSTRTKACMNEVAAIKATPATTRVFTPTNMSACLSQTGTVYAKSLITPADLATVADACGYVYQGNVAKYSACTVNYDCADKTNICDKGFCAPKMVVATSAQCSEDGAICPTAQYCAPVTMSNTMVCTNKLASGASCASAPCQDTLRCSGGTCQPLLGLNAACCTDSDCAAAAPYCNPYAGYECTAGLEFATHSPSCSAFGDTMAAAPTGTPACGGSPDGGAGPDGAAGAGGTDGGDASEAG